MSMVKNTLARSIDILVVDDSAVVRQSLKEIIEKENAFRVQVAADPYEAVAVMSKTAPKAMVLDIDMPRMDGLTFLKKLMRQHPLPVLLVTDHPGRGVAALELGALEVIAKPDWHNPDGLQSWAENLRDRLRLAVHKGDIRYLEESSRILAQPRHEADVVLARRRYQPHSTPTPPLIVVGASTGGVQALTQFLSLFPKDSPGLVIVQHMPAGFTTAFADRLNGDTNIPIEVREAKYGETIRQGLCYVIPGGQHGLIRRATNNFWIELVDGPPVCRHKPSVEVLFRSTAQAAGPKAAGVLLTGMGDDGAGGLLEMHEAGAFTIAQGSDSPRRCQTGPAAQSNTGRGDSLG